MHNVQRVHWQKIVSCIVVPSKVFVSILIKYPLASLSAVASANSMWHTPGRCI